MASTSPKHIFKLHEPPPYCEYAGGACDQVFDDAIVSDGFFLYPNDPTIIAATIEEGVRTLRRIPGERVWKTWKDLGIAGQIIFCQICKTLRFTHVAVADVTTLNFNLLFEIGFCLGLGVPLIPIRDTSFVRDHKAFDELGLLDTLGYLDYHNSRDLAEYVHERAKSASVPVLGNVPPENREQPLYVVKSHIVNEGMVRLMSTLKKSGLRFRSFDPRETPRLSLSEAFKQVHSSLGVVVHLVSPSRSGAVTQNARCAFVAGMALAAGKKVLMLQETEVRQPIDYRDIIKTYSNPRQISDLIIPLIRSVVSTLQDAKFIPVTLPLNPLEKIDLGDVAAENEIKALSSYFVPTGQYNEAKNGHARLVVGRKGAGKTAIFYGVRAAYKPSKSHLVLDLKPEGHQFTKLREAVLKELSPGLQEHVLTAFWNYLLLMEIAHKVVVEDSKSSYRDTRIRDAYKQVEQAYGSQSSAEEGDFSERLLALVDDIVKRRGAVGQIAGTSEVTQIVYAQDIKPLNDALSEYLNLTRKDDIWLLFDNLDKGWPISDVRMEDIAILKSLLEATRKLQRQFESRHVDFHVVVFIRNDIYQHLLLDPADRGKDTAVVIDWNDPEVFKEILRRRIVLSTELAGTFEDLWGIFFESHVRGEESFSYILSRTLMRPREVIRFTRDCIDTAINRGHTAVNESDILHTERTYSNTALIEISMELKDVSSDYADVPYAFIGCCTVLPKADLENRLKKANVRPEKVGSVIDLLLWFGFLGIVVYPDEERYSYQFQHDLKRMLGGVAEYSYCIHPGFREALGCSET
jgi:hypothetical protein